MTQRNDLRCSGIHWSALVTGQAMCFRQGGAPIGRLDRPPDPRPYGPALSVAPIEHQTLQTGRLKLQVAAVLLDQQLGRPPDVKIGHHHNNSLRMVQMISGNAVQGHCQTPLNPAHSVVRPLAPIEGRRSLSLPHGIPSLRAPTRHAAPADLLGRREFRCERSSSARDHAPDESRAAPRRYLAVGCEAIQREDWQP